MPSRPPVHKPPGHQDRQEQSRRYDQRRGSAGSRGYGRRWRKLRAVVLAQEPLCRRCNAEGKTKAAEHLHHVDGNVSNLARDNLEPLCAAHHNAIDAFGRVGRVKGAGADGTPLDPGHPWHEGG